MLDRGLCGAAAPTGRCQPFRRRLFTTGERASTSLALRVSICPLHDVEALALRRLLCLRRFIVGGEACRLLSQVGQLGALGGFLSLGGLVIGGQGRCLMGQDVDFPLHDVEALALRRLLLPAPLHRWRRGPPPVGPSRPVGRSGRFLQLLGQGVDLLGRLRHWRQRSLGLLGQGVDLSLHDVEALALRRLLCLRCFIVGGKGLPPVGPSRPVGRSGRLPPPGRPRHWRSRPRPAGPGCRSALHDVEALALRRLLCLRRFIVGGKGRRLLSQVGQLGALGGFSARAASSLAARVSICPCMTSRRWLWAVSCACAASSGGFVIGGKGCGLLGPGCRSVPA